MHSYNPAQNVAINALKHFVQAYLVSSDKKVIHDVITKYLKLLSDPNVAARRGSALALGAMPLEFLANNWRDVLLKLCSSCAIEVQY